MWEDIPPGVQYVCVGMFLFSRVNLPLTRASESYDEGKNDSSPESVFGTQCYYGGRTLYEGRQNASYF